MAPDRTDSEAVPLAPLGGLSSRSDRVAEVIRDAILSGRLEPGTSLVERRLATMLGVSKTPVREALIGLARSGLVVLNPNRGVTVRVIDLPTLRSIYEVRLQLEPWAVGRAVPVLPAGVLADAQAAMREAMAAVERDDTACLARINRRFHRSLYAHCGNELVREILDDLQDQLSLGIATLLWREWPTWRSEAGEHVRILRAVEAGDAEAAESAMRAHIARSLDKMRQAPRRGGPRTG